MKKIVLGLCFLYGLGVFAQENKQKLFYSKRLLELYDCYKASLTIVSENKVLDIALLRKHIEYLEKQKKQINSIYQRYVVPYIWHAKWMVGGFGFWSTLHNLDIYQASALQQGVTIGQLLIGMIKVALLLQPTIPGGSSVAGVRMGLLYLLQRIMLPAALAVFLHVISQRNVLTQNMIKKIDKLIARDQEIISHLQ